MQEQRRKLLKHLGRIIRNYRKNQSISKLSNEIDLSKSIWWEVEKGNKDIQISTFWRIAEGLDIKPSELLKELEKTMDENFSFLD